MQGAGADQWCGRSQLLSRSTATTRWPPPPRMSLPKSPRALCQHLLDHLPPNIDLGTEQGGASLPRRQVSSSTKVGAATPRSSVVSGQVPAWCDLSRFCKPPASQLGARLGHPANRQLLGSHPQAISQYGVKETTSANQGLESTDDLNRFQPRTPASLIGQSLLVPSFPASGAASHSRRLITHW